MSSTLGNRINKYRKEKGMPQEELAEKLGVSPQAVSKWENDVSCPDIALLPTLADVLGVTTDELLTGSSEQVRLVPVGKRKSLDQLTLRVRINSAGGDKVNVNLPMPLVKLALEMGIDVGGSYAGANGELLKKLDLSQILSFAEQGLLGKLVEMESADGDTVEVVVE